MKRILILLVLLVLPVLVSARLMQGWTYQQMFDKADLVAIARPVATKATAETNTLENITPELKVIGWNTEFEVSMVLKGEKVKFVLHHYRLAKPESLDNGPFLVSFDPAQDSAFLLFLIKEPEGRYAPVTGQTDPGMFSVIKLEGFAR